MSIAFNIPIENGLIPSWLERQITGTQLGRLVGELEVLHGQAAQRTAGDICGDFLDDVTENGLGCLPPRIITDLLRNPRSLLEIQEHVLEAGSPYWLQLSAKNDAGQRSRHLQNVVVNSLGGKNHSTHSSVADKTDRGTGYSDRQARDQQNDGQFSEADVTDDGADADVPVRPSDGRQSRRAFSSAVSDHSAMRRRRLLRWTLSSAAAAVLLITVVTQWPTNGAPRGWGFSSPDLLAFEGRDQKFLDHLADAAGQWSNKQPSDNSELRERLAQFSEGCGQLIRTLEQQQLNQLTPEAQQWLHDRCLAWKGRIDGHIAAIDNQSESFEQVRDHADETVEKLITALRTGPTA
ncbi:MAG: hypothetical protein KDA89_08240 [Planctomycetaceae bacterium]|nr:hypothetical protein [Planctomycetaceae bacterium]